MNRQIPDLPAWHVFAAAILMFAPQHPLDARPRREQREPLDLESAGPLVMEEEP